jgi:hypothetical protein
VVVTFQIFFKILSSALIQHVENYSDACVQYKCFCLQTAFQRYADPTSAVAVQVVRNHSTCGFSGFRSGIAEDSVLGSDVASLGNWFLTLQDNIRGVMFNGRKVDLFGHFDPRREGHYFVLERR